MQAKMSTRMFLVAAFWILFLIAPVFLISCGGGGGGGGESDFPGQRIFAEAAIVSASDGNVGDNYGQAVAISDNTILVGADSAAYVLERDVNGNWNEVGKLTASDGFPGDGFGRTLALSRDAAIIGAENDDDNGSESGSAYVFVKPEGGWLDMTETKKLTANDSEPGDNFGSAVSLVQIRTPAVLTSIAVVGAKYGGDSNQRNKGSAYVFYDHIFTDAPKTVDWEQVTELLNPHGSDYDGFGSSVANIEEDQIVIGAPYSGLYDQNGSAYVFKASGSWSYPPKMQSFDPPDGVYESFCGYSVVISEENILMGCPNFGEYWHMDSKVYAYTIDDSGDWLETDVILNLQFDEIKGFGGAVSLSGNTAVVGSSQFPFFSTPLNTDWVHVYQRHTSGRWYDVASLAPAQPVLGHHYGFAVAISRKMPRNTIAIGSPGGHSDTGLVYIYEEQ